MSGFQSVISYLPIPYLSSPIQSDPTAPPDPSTKHGAQRFQRTRAHLSDKPVHFLEARGGVLFHVHQRQVVQRDLQTRCPRQTRLRCK